MVEARAAAALMPSPSDPRLPASAPTSAQTELPQNVSDQTPSPLGESQIDASPASEAGASPAAQVDSLAAADDLAQSAAAQGVTEAAQLSPEDADPASQTPSHPPKLSAQERMVEAILFASAEPISVAQMNDRMPPGSDAAEAVRMLEKRYAGRGVEVRRIGDAWAIRTASDLGFLMRREVVETRKLSRAAIETLAIIAYHQPITRSEIEEIRGVAVSRGTIDQLLELDWIRFGRRKMTPGRPVTFVVTEAFLDHFGLSNSRDLPGLKELRAAGLLESRGLPGGDPLEPLLDPAPVDPDEADQPDPAQPDMFGK